MLILHSLEKYSPIQFWKPSDPQPDLAKPIPFEEMNSSEGGKESEKRKRTIAF